jgi:hypothetical protein
MMTSVLEVRFNHPDQFDTNYYLGDDEDMPGGPDAVTVIDIVDAHRLKEVELDKKTWTGIIKGTFLFNSKAFCRVS